MVRQPLVSVLVLTYNHEPYLAEALESILGQDFADAMEVLIGEDCSTDETRAVAQQFVATYPDVVRIISSEHNVGMHTNNARLLAASRGEFVAYCEGDDFWCSPAKLRLQVSHLQKHPEQVGVHSDVDHLIQRGDQGQILPAFWRHHRPGKATSTTFDDLLEENLVQTCSVLLRGEIARSFVGSPLDAGRYAVADWPLFLHSTMSGPLGYIPDVLATYRRVPGSATNQGTAATERRVSDQIRLLTDASRMHSHNPAKLTAGLSKTRRALVMTGIEAGDRPMALRWVRESQRAGDQEALSGVAKALVRVPGAVAVAGALLRARQALIEVRNYRGRRTP